MKEAFREFGALSLFVCLMFANHAFAQPSCFKFLESPHMGYRSFVLKELTPTQKWRFFEKLVGQNVLLEITSDRTGDGETIDLGVLEGLRKGSRINGTRDQLCLKLRPTDQRGEICIEFRVMQSIRVRGTSNNKDKKYFPQIDLDQEIKLSRLSPKVIELLTRHSLGIGTMYDLIDKVERFRYSAAILGLDIPEYATLAKALNLEKYHSIYRQLRFSPDDSRDHTEIFMDSLKGRKTVFLIPRNFLKYFDKVEYSSREGTGITIAEFKWLLKDPRRLSNVYFVFGAYNAIAAHFPADSTSEEKMLEDYFSNYPKYQFAD